MGADIHIALERFVDNEWVYQKEDFERFWAHEGKTALNSLHWVMNNLKDRDYGFFAALANVRGPGPSPNGWPNDVSQDTLDALGSEREDGSRSDPRTECDLHSHAHYSLEHAMALKLSKNEDAFEKVCRQAVGKLLMHTIAGIPETEKEEDWRVIFAFDN